MKELTNQNENIDLLKDEISLYVLSMDEVLDKIANEVKGTSEAENFDLVLSQIRLYNIDGPQVLLSANYGVPQIL